MGVFAGPRATSLESAGRGRRASKRHLPVVGGESSPWQSAGSRIARSALPARSERVQRHWPKLDEYKRKRDPKRDAGAVRRRGARGRKAADLRRPAPRRAPAPLRLPARAGRRACELGRPEGRPARARASGASPSTSRTTRSSTRRSRARSRRASTAPARSRSGTAARTSSLEEKQDGGLTVRLHGKRLERRLDARAGAPRRQGAELAADPQARRRRERAADARPRRTRRCSPRSSRRSRPGEGWLFEVKWDGYRALALRPRRRVRAREPRTSNDLTERFAAVAQRAAEGDADAELRRSTARSARSTSRAAPSFSVMQQGAGDARLLRLRRARGRRRAARRPAARASAATRLEALLDRRNATVRLSEAFDDGEALLEAASAQGLEGVDRQARRLPLRAGQAHARLAEGQDAHGRQEFVIAGYTKGEGRRVGTLRRARARRRTRAASWRWVGNVGTGFDEAEIERLLEAAAAARAPTSPPFRDVAEDAAACARATSSGSSRSSSPRSSSPSGRTTATSARRRTRACARTRRREEVRRERPDREVEVRKGKRVLRLSNLDKVFWPDEGITKGDLLDYYRDVAPVLVPHLRDRPFTMKRYPDGIDGQVLLPEGRAQAHARVDPDVARTASTTRERPRREADDPTSRS